MQNQKPIQQNHHPRVQSNKNVISYISSFQVSNLFGLTPTGNIKQFNGFFNDLSEGTLCTSDLKQTNIHTFNDSPEYAQLNHAYNQIITHQDEITNPNIQLCPDFLKQCPNTKRINVYEMKAKMKTQNKIPSISFNIEQFLKYQIHLADRWDSNFMVVCYLYTLEKDIIKTKEPRHLVKHIQPTDIVLIPSDYIIQYSSNFKNALDKLNLNIKSIEDDGPKLLSDLRTVLKEPRYKYNSAYSTISAQDISDIISDQTTHKVYQQELEIPSETIRWTDAIGKNRWLTTKDNQIQISCVENGQNLKDFWKSITQNIPKIETDGGLNKGLSQYLAQKSYNARSPVTLNTLSTYT